MFAALIQLVLLAPLLLVLALVVRFAGASRALNVVDYARVNDPAALHRCAGHRLALLPILYLIGGYAAYHLPGLGWLFFAIATVACLCVTCWLALAAERFQSAP